MATRTLAEALEQEHREIDEGIETFTSGRATGPADSGPLTRAIDALRRHIYLEEEFLFPPLRSAGMVAPIFVMLREHGEMWKTLDALEAKLGEDGKAESVMPLCDQLVPQIQAHNAKEEPILYSQADAVLDDVAADQLRTFLDSGRMPQGWVCEKARS